MSHRKLIGLLVVPFAVAAIGGGVFFASHQASAIAAPATPEAVETVEAVNQPEKAEPAGSIDQQVGSIDQVGESTTQD